MASRYASSVKASRQADVAALLSCDEFQLPPDSLNHATALQWIMQQFDPKAHRHLDAEKGKVLEHVIGVSEKLLLNGKQTEARRLLELANKLAPDTALTSSLVIMTGSSSSNASRAQRNRSTLAHPVSAIALLLMLHDTAPQSAATTAASRRASLADAAAAEAQAQAELESQLAATNTPRSRRSSAAQQRLTLLDSEALLHSDGVQTTADSNSDAASSGHAHIDAEIETNDDNDDSELDNNSWAEEDWSEVGSDTSDKWGVGEFQTIDGHEAERLQQEQLAHEYAEQQQLAAIAYEQQQQQAAADRLYQQALFDEDYQAEEQFTDVFKHDNAVDSGNGELPSIEVESPKADSQNAQLQQHDGSNYQYEQYHSTVQHNYGKECLNENCNDLKLYSSKGSAQPERVPELVIARPCELLASLIRTPSSVTHAQYSTSIVPETDIVTAVLHMLQGLSSAIFDRHSDSTTTASTNVGGDTGVAAVVNSVDTVFLLTAAAADNMAVLHLSPLTLRHLLEWCIDIANTVEYIRMFVDTVQTDAVHAMAHYTATASSSTGSTSSAKHQQCEFGSVISAFAECISEQLQAFEAHCAKLERRLYKAQQGGSRKDVNSTANSGVTLTATLIQLQDELTVSKHVQRLQDMQQLISKGVPFWCDVYKESVNNSSNSHTNSTTGTSNRNGAAVLQSNGRKAAAVLLDVIHEALITDGLLHSTSSQSAMSSIVSQYTASQQQQQHSITLNSTVSDQWLLYLFSRTVKPLLQILDTWLSVGKICDTHSELFISMQADTAPLTSTAAIAGTTASTASTTTAKQARRINFEIDTIANSNATNSSSVDAAAVVIECTGVIIHTDSIPCCLKQLAHDIALAGHDVGLMIKIHTLIGSSQQQQHAAAAAAAVAVSTGSTDTSTMSSEKSLDDVFSASMVTLAHDLSHGQLFSIQCNTTGTMSQLSSDIATTTNVGRVVATSRRKHSKTLATNSLQLQTVTEDHEGSQQHYTFAIREKNHTGDNNIATMATTTAVTTGVMFRPKWTQPHIQDSDNDSNHSSNSDDNGSVHEPNDNDNRSSGDVSLADIDVALDVALVNSSELNNSVAVTAATDVMPHTTTTVDTVMMSIVLQQCLMFLTA
jgi:Gamma tubulin complex component N-terminal